MLCGNTRSWRKLSFGKHRLSNNQSACSAWPVNSNNQLKTVKMTSEKVLTIIFLNIFLLISRTEGRGNQYVTCGSVAKLFNTDYKVRLHSHDVKYGSGSGQQSVTGTEIQEDVNSHWVIKGATGKFCNRGEPIKCGDVIRFEHLATNKNLHSHHFPSPLSNNQEISAYGDLGDGDSGDHWVVVCRGDHWLRSEAVMFKHVDTDMLLSVTGRTYGRPINGQFEVVGLSSPSSSHWKTEEGLFIHPSEFQAKALHEAHNMHAHSEL